MNSRIVYLDGIRIISSIVVFIAHAIQIFLMPKIGSNSNIYFIAGQAASYAVVIFFILSGYMVTNSILNNQQRNGYFDLNKYWKDRLLRLYPPLVFSIVLSCGIFVIIKFFHLHGSVSFRLIGDIDLGREFIQYSIKELIASLFFLQGLDSVFMSMNGPLWSLGDEFFLYVIASFVSLILLNHKRIIPISLLILLFYILNNTGHLKICLYLYIMWGIGAFFSLESRKLKNLISRKISILICVFSFLIWTSLFIFNNYKVPEVEYEFSKFSIFQFSVLIFVIYLQMRNDYIVTDSNIINKVSALNGLLNPKYSITESTGVLGTLHNADVKKICNELNTEGYYIFPNSLSKELVNELKEFALNTPMHYFEIGDGAPRFTKDAVKYKDNKTLSNRYQILDISNLKESEAILKIVTDENFLHIANEYLGAKPIIDIITMWWSACLSSLQEDKRNALKSASAQMFHVDMDRLKFLKFFVYLTDVDTNTGPHVYVKKSHNVIPSYIKTDGRYSDELISESDNENIVEITGKAGSIIAVDTRGLHKGKELKEGERLIFQIEFTNSLFGNPDMPQINDKFKYKGNSNYFKSYNYFFFK